MLRTNAGNDLKNCSDTRSKNACSKQTNKLLGGCTCLPVLCARVWVMWVRVQLRDLVTGSSNGQREKVQAPIKV